MKSHKWVLLLTLGMLFSCRKNADRSQEAATLAVPQLVQPSEEHPRYWAYRDKTVLLLGASDDDNLFQWSPDMLIPHLDAMKEAGANYLRNTMSDRPDKGHERYPFLQLADGKYDLTKWDSTYWAHFDFFLKATAERDIVVQIEIWDRFDYSRDNWLAHPYNPANNINYTHEASGLAPTYPDHPNANKQPFFFTTPLQHNNTTILAIQQAFVKELLRISLNYGHVLYCIDNETSGEEAWATYWAGFIREQAGGSSINITQMWDNWNVKAGMHKRTIDHPERYNYIDISQNSQIPGVENWENAQYVIQYIAQNPRPVNSTKIYGNDAYQPWQDRGMNTQHAVQTFFRNVLGGFASSRFHRPTHGLGLRDISANAIRSVRLLEEVVKPWELHPRMDLLETEPNMAYLVADGSKKWVLYFTGVGDATLNLSDFAHTYDVKYLAIGQAAWHEGKALEGGQKITLSGEYEHGCLVLLIQH